MVTRNIVIAPCGNRSDFFNRFWLKQKSEKQFDICLLFYHEQINNPELYTEADFFFHLKDFKYHMIYKLLTSIHPDWLQRYEYFYFLDDDIEIDTLQINSLFLLSRALNSWISQASLTKDSFCSWPMFKQQKDSFCRFVGQIEVMAPLFSADTLKKCIPAFISNRSSWGLDSVWSKILNYPEDKLIVFDSVQMRHTQPVGGGELYKKIGIDPQDDWKHIIKMYNAKKHNYQEYGRLQIVNKHHNRFKFFWHKCNEAFSKLTRRWHDYDLPSRIKSQKNKILGKIRYRNP